MYVIGKQVLQTIYKSAQFPGITIPNLTESV